MKGLHAALLLACVAVCRAQSADQGVTVIASPVAPPDPSCFKPGITAAFYDLTQGQAQYLAGQFPFINGPGQLLDTLRPSEVLLLPQLAYGSGVSDPRIAPWPRKFPENSNGTIATFDTELLVPATGFWTFFVTSSGSMQMTLSQNGTFLQAMQSGDELDVNATTIEGTVHQIEYTLTTGTYQLHLEWHAGLPGNPLKDKLLILEWGYQANPTTVPSPSPPIIPRTVIPPASFSTLCSTTPATGPSVVTPIFPSPPPQPRGAPPPPRVISSLAPTSPAAAQPPAYANFSCIARYSITNKYQQNSEYYGTLNVYLAVAGATVPVPYTVTINNPSYINVLSAFNIQVTSPLQNGMLTGTATYAWETLLPSGPSVNIGGEVVANSSNLTPASLSINNVPCVLQPY